MKKEFAKGALGDTPFRLAVASALVLLTLYFLTLVFSMVTYAKGDVLWSALVSSEIFYAVRLSLATASLATLLAVGIAIPAAYALSQMEFPGKFIVDTILDLPIVVSPVALGAALLIFFNTSAGTAIENTGVRFVFELPGIVLAQFTVVSALAVRLLKSSFDGIDPRYEQVGRTLGYTRFQVFRRVTLPMIRHGLLAAIILTWARAVGEFGATITLAGATTMKTETLPVAIFLNLATADVERAIAVILILIGLAATALVSLRLLSGRRYQQ